MQTKNNKICKFNSGLRKAERDVNFSDKIKNENVYKHISKEERRIIEGLTQTGGLNKRIAEVLEQAQKLVNKRRKGANF